MLPGSSDAQDAGTIGTKVVTFRINVFDGVSVMHDTFKVMAMDQTQGVPQFMHRFFFTTLQEESVILRKAIDFLAKTVCGYKRALFAELGLPENIGKNGNI